MRKTFRGKNLLGLLVMAGALALTGALVGCGEKDGAGGTDAATNKKPNTSLPRLYTVRRGQQLAAVVFNMGGTPAYGHVIFTPSMLPISPADDWQEAGNQPPPAGWCPTYAAQLPGAMEADWSQPEMVDPEEDWRPAVNNMTNQKPCE